MDLYRELLSFFNELKEYKELLEEPASELPKRELAFLPKELKLDFPPLLRKTKEALREKLVRKSGQLSPHITELTKKQHVERWGRVYDIWSTGLTANPSAPINHIALDFCIDATNEAIGKLKDDISKGIRAEQGNLIQKPPTIPTEPSKAFIAHEGETTALKKLKDFLDALGIGYLIAEIDPSNGRLVEPQVQWAYGQADFVIILATRGKAVNRKTGVPYMALNIADELGRAREAQKRVILLLETGVEPHTNISGIVHERFTHQGMDKAFIKIVKELRNWGFLTTGKIEE